MSKKQEISHTVILDLIDYLQNLSIWNWLTIILATLFCLHFTLHKRDASLSPKKICKCISFFLIVFISTIFCNLAMRDIMAYRQVLHKEINDIAGFYNNIITYLSLAFAVLSVVAYNSIKVLTEEKAKNMVKEELKNTYRTLYKKILTQTGSLEQKIEKAISELDTTINERINENFGEKYGEKIDKISKQLNNFETFLTENREDECLVADETVNFPLETDNKKTEE